VIGLLTGPEQNILIKSLSLFGVRTVGRELQKKIQSDMPPERRIKKYKMKLTLNVHSHDDNQKQK